MENSCKSAHISTLTGRRFVSRKPFCYQQIVPSLVGRYDRVRGDALSAKIIGSLPKTGQRLGQEEGRLATRYGHGWR